MWRVTWAHPEFGQVLATCSFDRTAAVWEELSSNASCKGGSSTNTWLKRASLVDSRTSVTDVRFAPKHLGLQLVNIPTLFPLLFLYRLCGHFVFYPVLSTNYFYIFNFSCKIYFSPCYIYSKPQLLLFTCMYLSVNTHMALR